MDRLREMSQAFIDASQEPDVAFTVGQIVGILKHLSPHAPQTALHNVGVHVDKVIIDFKGDKDVLMKGLVHAMRFQNYPSHGPQSDLRDDAAYFNFRLANIVKNHAPAEFNLMAAADHSFRQTHSMNHGTTFRHEADRRAGIHSAPRPAA